MKIQEMFNLQAIFARDKRVPKEVAERGLEILAILTDVERKCDWYSNACLAHNMLKKRLVEVRSGAAHARLDWDEYVKKVEELRARVIVAENDTTTQPIVKTDIGCEFRIGEQSEL